MALHEHRERSLLPIDARQFHGFVGRARSCEFRRSTGSQLVLRLRGGTLDHGCRCRSDLWKESDLPCKAKLRAVTQSSHALLSAEQSPFCRRHAWGTPIDRGSLARPAIIIGRDPALGG